MCKVFNPKKKSRIILEFGVGGHGPRNCINKMQTVKRMACGRVSYELNRAENSESCRHDIHINAYSCALSVR